MASAGLKRSSPSDLSPQSTNLSASFWSANKRRCTTQMPQQQRPFRDSASIIGSLSDDVTAMIRNEIAKHQQQQQQQQQQHHHHHHQSQQQNQQQPHQHIHNHHNQQPQSSNQNQLQQQQHHLQQQLDEQLQHHPSHQLHASATNQHQHQNQNQSTSSASNHLDAPLLSIRQTQAICEQLIREREQKLREEYDKILISKLAEQFDTYVKYTHDHIERRNKETNSHQASYLS